MMLPLFPHSPHLITPLSPQYTVRQPFSNTQMDMQGFCSCSIYLPAQTVYLTIYSTRMAMDVAKWLWGNLMYGQGS